MTTELAVMTTQEVADQLFQYCKEGKWEEAQNALFNKDAESIEPPHSQGVQHVQGIENIRAKSKSWSSMVEEVHGGYVRGPLVAGNHISLAIGMDVTMKGAGRMNTEEIALYEVRDGQIVKEQFFY